MQCIVVKSGEFENSYSLLYILLINPVYVAAHSLRSLRSKHWPTRNSELRLTTSREVHYICNVYVMGDKILIPIDDGIFFETKLMWSQCFGNGILTLIFFCLGWKGKKSFWQIQGLRQSLAFVQLLIILLGEIIWTIIWIWTKSSLQLISS